MDTRVAIDGVMPSEQLLRQIRKKTDTIILSFSCGKDSIAAWIACRDVFPNIVPYYLYLVPELDFVEQSIRYFEGLMGRKIIRLAHPSLYRMLNNFVFQPPERCAIIEAANLPNFDYADIRRVVFEDEGLPLDTLVANGVRACDSPQRRIALMRYGPQNHKTGFFNAVWDWRKSEVVDSIESAGIKLPIDYRYFKRSFDGIDHRFLRPIKDNFPSDYAKILDWFPLADLELFRKGEHACQSQNRTAV